MAINKTVLDQLMPDCGPGDLVAGSGLLANLMKALSERMLAAEFYDFVEAESTKGAKKLAAPRYTKRFLRVYRKSTLYIMRYRESCLTRG